jgi:pilus assembly protein FimV
MTVYNKLKIAILAILASQPLHAITIDPIQIQSAPGELLYAEINFRQSDSNQNLQASLANADDLTRMGVSHQPPGHLNFFTRRDSSGNGVITITSSRPMTDSELNIVVKISEGNAIRLQHIKTPLKRSSSPHNTLANLSHNERPLAPLIIRNENEIGLNLPVSTAYTATAPKTTNPVHKNEAPLNISRSAPPSLNSSSAQTLASVSPVPQAYAVPAPMVKAVAPVAPIAPPAPVPKQTVASAQAPAPAPTVAKHNNTAEQTATSVAAPPAMGQVSQDPLVKEFSEAKASQKPAQPTEAPTHQAPVSKSPVSVQAPPPLAKAEYVVQSNETLWGIASRVATAQNRPIGEVMKQIKASNEHAFIQGDSNRLRRGVALNLNNTVPSKEQPKVNAAALAKIPSAQSGKAKYRLNQAEMSLISENERDSAHTTANKNTEKNQTSDKLSLKIMTSREKTVKLQRNVTQLELALNQKDQRIQLLNTRLAQLEEKLKAQRAAKKPIH